MARQDTSNTNLFQGDNESRLVASRQEFYGDFTADFIPLNDSDAHVQSLDYVVPQPKEVPGDPGGAIPGIASFHSPTRGESSIFQKIYFDTDKDRPKSNDHYQALKKLANYLKKHPNVYIFIEGHCDERASEAYNQALGTRFQKQSLMAENQKELVRWFLLRYESLAQL